MKALLQSAIFTITLGSILLGPFHANGQLYYFALTNESSLWNYERTIECEPYSPYYGFRYSMKIEGDTNIAGITYSRLFRPTWEFFVPEWFDGTVDDCFPWAIPDTGYVGGLRDNYGERKVYFVKAGTEQEILLYDFSLNVGDTLDFYFDPDVLMQLEDPIIVASIDSVEIGNSLRLRWNFTTPNNIGSDNALQLIAGIGGTAGLIEPDPFFLMHSPQTSLTCFSMGNVHFYPPGTSSCEMITHTTDFPAPHDELILFPNPASTQLSVILPEKSIRKSTTIEVFDIGGRPVYQTRHNGNRMIQLNTENWNAGIYVLRMNYEGDSHVSRFVVD